jgi:hypothetical protein
VMSLSDQGPVPCSRRRSASTHRPPFFLVGLLAPVCHRTKQKTPPDVTTTSCFHLRTLSMTTLTEHRHHQHHQHRHHSFQRSKMCRGSTCARLGSFRSLLLCVRVF